MRILVLLTETFNAGGIQRINRHVCLALSQFAERERHRVRFLSLMDDPDYINNHYLEGDASFTGFRGNRVAFMRAALRELRDRPDVVYAAHVNLAPLALTMRWLRPSLHYGVALYGIEVWGRLPSLKRRALQRADFITSLSAYTSQQTVKLQNVKSERIHLVPPALDPFWISAAEESLPEEISLALPRGKKVLTVSRLAAAEGYKGVDCVIQAMPTVLEQISDAHYIVVGTGDDLPRLRSLAEREGVQDRVLFVGRKVGASLRAYYRNCDLFAMPSKGEGFGIVFLEAMFYKKPVIVGDHGGSREIAEPGHTGLLVKHGDIEGLATAMIDLLSDDERCTQIGSAGYEHLMSTYTYPHFRYKIERLMQEVL